MSNSNTQTLIIFDTTLRDGEQSPGASMNRDEKLRIASALEKLRVDVIEAGFAIASPGDFKAIAAIAATITESVVCSLARARIKDIDAAGQALEQAPAKRIHTFIATSPLHLKHKLKQTPEEVLQTAVGAVKHARRYTDDIEFSCEDASRSDFDFMCQVVERVIEAGATTINLPDTVGYGIPGEFGSLIKRIMNNVPNADKAVFSVHCHNDLGLAVANSLDAVSQGARQVECTINGLGERAGNASLEEVVMAVKTRSDIFNLETSIDTRQIVSTSRLVSSITGFPVQPNKAIVGANAFAHEAGIHQDGVLKYRETYEIMRAEDVGWSSNKIVLGKHSGRAAFRKRLETLGITLQDEEKLSEAFKRFKELADKKHEIFDEDLQALTLDLSPEQEGRYRLISLQSSNQNGEPPTAEVVLTDNGKQLRGKSEGSGPIDAALRAIEMEVKSDAELKIYLVSALSAGTDAQGEVTVRLEKAGRIVNGTGADTDIVVASAKAYLNALNLLASDAPTPEQKQGI